MSDEQPCEKESQPARHISRPRLVQASLFARTEDPVLMALREADVATMTAEGWRSKCGGGSGSWGVSGRRGREYSVARQVIASSCSASRDEGKRSLSREVKPSRLKF